MGGGCDVSDSGALLVDCVPVGLVLKAVAYEASIYIAKKIQKLSGRIYLTETTRLCHGSIRLVRVRPMSSTDVNDLS